MIGNLHINIIADKWDPKVEKLIEPFVYEVVGTFGHDRPSVLHITLGLFAWTESPADVAS